MCVDHYEEDARDSGGQGETAEVNQTAARKTNAIKHSEFEMVRWVILSGLSARPITESWERMVNPVAEQTNELLERHLKPALESTRARRDGYPKLFFLKVSGRVGSVLCYFRDAFQLYWFLLQALITTNPSASRSFKLKPPKHYFQDEKTLALLAAAMKGDLSKAKQLVVEGANPNDEGPLDNKYNRLRLLHYAIAANNKEAVKVLISVGADPELSAQGFGRSFLFAMTLENIKMISLLLDLRPITTLSKDTMEYILFESVTSGCSQCLELYLDRGAPIDFPDESGYTVLMRAMDAQDYEMAEWLLLRGASVHVEAGGGITPAYSVQFHLNKFKLGSPTYNKVLHLKKLMEERGAVFPALSPAEVRAKREKH